MTLAEFIVYFTFGPVVVVDAAAVAVFVCVVMPIMMVRRLINGPQPYYDYEGA